MDHKPFTVFGLALAVILLVPTASLAVGGQTYEWIGVSGDWSIAGNWHPSDGPPSGYDKAIIGIGVEVTSDKGAGVSQLSIGPGNSLVISEWSLSFNSNFGAVETFIVNNGFIRVQNRMGGAGANIVTWGNNVSFQGNGTIYLGGNYPQDSLTDAGYGGTVTNTATHTIRGGGVIAVNLINQGPLTADNSTLNFTQRYVTNTGSTMSASGSGNVLGFISCPTVSGGQINPQDGKVYLWGSAFSNLTFGPGSVEAGGTTYLQDTITFSPGTTCTVLEGAALIGNLVNLVNNGAILTNGNTDNYAYVSGWFSFLGTGHLTLTGEGNYLSCYNPTTNSESHTIQGGGFIDGEGLINNGPIIANNGVLTLDCPVTGTGTFAVTDGATLVINQPLQTGDLTMSHLASLTWNSYGYIDLKRNFSFYQTDPARWNSEATRIKLSGGGGGGAVQTLEVGGQDQGASIAGLTDNFALAQLRLEGTGTQAALVDLIDNGHRTGAAPEALYVEILQVLTGTTLDLKGLKLYAKVGEVMHRVVAGDSLFGDGQIIDTGRGKALPSLFILLD